MKRLLYGYIFPLVAVLALLVTPMQRGVILAEGPTGTLVSDGFEGGGLDTTVWSYIDPLRDGRVYFTQSGTGESLLALSVPGGKPHDDWRGSNLTPRLMQWVSNSDLSMEIKFASAVTAPNQEQGLYFEQDDGDYLRVGLWSDGSATRVIVTRYRSGTPFRAVDLPVASSATAPLFLRVQRLGDQWMVLFATDGVNWQTAGTTTQALALGRAGIYVANAGENPVAHTALVDYVANLDIVDADAPGMLPMSTSIDTAPLIYNEEIIAGQTKARLDWLTDRPATGTVRYGQTETYELGTIVTGKTSLEHSVLVPDLLPATAYYFEAESSSGGAPATVSLSGTLRPQNGDTGPTLDIWYGLEQSFGTPAKAQKWANILGDVSDEDGVESLVCSLNGGAERAISIGPNGTRLANAGDFNIDILFEQDLTYPTVPYLSPLTNTLTITATDTLSNVASSTVLVYYDNVSTSAPPLDIDWNTTSSIQDVGQVSDGQWSIVGDNVRPTVANRYTYDRIIAIGDYQNWENYEVTVPITIHALYGGDPGVGLITRWEGHDIDNLADQPHMDYRTFGALGWYRFKPFTGFGRLALCHDSDSIAEDLSGRTLELDTPYYFKMRVETQPGGSILHLLKVWEVGTSEPDQWDLGGTTSEAGDEYGAIALLAHRADASFGDVSVTAIPGGPELVMSNILATPGGTTATITWNTDLPADSLVEYGPTVAYGENASDGALVTGHSVTLTGLTPDTLYHFRVTSVDGGAISVTSSDLTFRTIDPTLISGIVSDDFDTCAISDTWEAVDPLGGSTFDIANEHTENAALEIAVPSGTSHDIWTQGVQSPRLMQTAEDTDFVLETKCFSGVSTQYQAQGILVQGNNGRWLRFDFYGDGSNTVAFAGSGYIPPGSSNTVTYTHWDEVVGGTGVAPLWLRVARVGDTWTPAYSTDGSTWNAGDPFTFVLEISSVGVFAANSGDTPPAHTASFDYFFETANPVDPEDGDTNSISISIVGSGSVTPNPDKTTYNCDELVTLTPIPEAGWAFSAWSGDVVSASNPLTVTMTGDTDLTATFVQEEYTVTTQVAGQGTVDVAPDQDTYQYGDIITLTATADPGWTFSAWSGGATGETNPVTTTVTSSTEVTATFTQDEYTVSVTLVGDGSAEVTPDQATYNYGDVITLTATADPGWTFSAWSGDVISETNPVTTTVIGNTDVTATFTQDEYAVSVSIVGSGTVSAVPDQATYHYGDVVTLTATADSEWYFGGWSGDLDGTDNPKALTVTGNMDVTATFSQNVLTINTVGQGTVTRDPDKQGYDPGEAVTLTATADPGWTFAGWSGDLEGSENPATVSVSGNMVITATFTQDEYALSVTVVGNGSVAVDPDQATYHYGDVVTLTATAEDGWAFSGWSGDVVGTDNPITTTITGPTDVTATFEESQTDVFLPLVWRQKQ